ncbi:MAG: phospholipase D family protein, partial [Gammaproteobacteria bacterium]|nr:phospholipase D family protein [Gammaproteobacteria bacterium]
MRLLRTGELTWRFEKHLEWATEVDIAVAWVTSCDAVAALIESAADTKVRIALGLSGNATDPSALESLASAEGVALRIAEPPRNGIFHWKYYCFRRAGEATCWIGSANLTRAGFHCNEEVVHEFDAEEAEVRQWFEDLWSTLDRDPARAIAEYGLRYESPGRSPSAPKPPAHEPDLPGAEFGEWADFVRGLRARDEYCHYVRRHHPYPQRVFGGETPWDIFGETHCYL